MYAVASKLKTFKNVKGMKNLMEAKVIEIATENLFVVKFEDGAIERKTLEQLLPLEKDTQNTHLSKGEKTDERPGPRPPIIGHQEQQQQLAAASSSAHMGEQSEVNTATRREMISEEVATISVQDDTLMESNVNHSPAESNNTVPEVKRSPRRRTAPVRFEASGFKSPRKSPRQRKGPPMDKDGSPGPRKRLNQNEIVNTGEQVTRNTVQEDSANGDDPTQFEITVHGLEEGMQVARVDSSCAQCTIFSQEIAELKKFFEEKLEQLRSELLEHQKQAHNN